MPGRTGDAMTKEECTEQLALAWLRGVMHDDATDPDKPTDDGHARGVLAAIERMDARIAELEEALGSVISAAMRGPKDGAVTWDDWAIGVMAAIRHALPVKGKP